MVPFAKRLLIGAVSVSSLLIGMSASALALEGTPETSEPSASSILLPVSAEPSILPSPVDPLTEPAFSPPENLSPEPVSQSEQVASTDREQVGLPEVVHFYQSEQFEFTPPDAVPDLPILVQPTDGSPADESDNSGHSKVELPGVPPETPKTVLVHRQIVPKTSVVKVGGQTVMQITPTVQTRVVEPESQAKAIASVAESLLLHRSLSGYAYPDMDGMPSYVPPAQLPTDSGYQGMVYPLARRVPITSGFGWRWGRMHKGIDFGAPTGTPVLAAFSGQVISAGWNAGGYGYLVVIQSSDNQTYYAHLSRVLVTPGQSVTAGQVIGAVGSTGFSTGPHLHFELRQWGNGGWVPVNAIAQVRVAAENIGRRDAPLSSTTGASAQAGADFNVRVALGVARSQVWIASTAPAVVLDVQGRSLMALRPMQNYAVTHSNGAIVINGVIVPGAVYIKPIAPNALSGVDNRWYRGTLSINLTRKGLTVVNHVPLEHYLASVVGAEVYPSWNLEALKAQAVAARSYAMYHLRHPLSRHYDICATEACQAYKGIASEHGSTNQAVYATRGQVLLDSRGKVLMAQYASTQDLVNEAHGGRGMAQWGAQDLALAGWNYLQILGHYYR